jgi:HD-GYP domain-containing protein (c-di-GMP phosphodiesterase class II)
MDRVRVRADLLQVGAPVPFDVFNSAGRLLLRHGHLVENEQQLERLVQSGLCDPASLEAYRQRTAAANRVVHDSRLPSQLARNRVSVFKLLGEAAGTMVEPLGPKAHAAGFQDSIRKTASAIRDCCALDSDAALAQILLSDTLAYSVRHPVNIAILTAILLSRLHHDHARTESAVCAALTMNVSISGLQDVLFAQQEPLTDEQRLSLKRHPVESANQLRGLGIDDPTWLQTVEQHHEGRDGSGYPAGLKEPAICREAQVVSLADRYCGLVSRRAYRPGLAPRKAIKELHVRTAAAIEPALIGALIAAVGLFPPGAYVRLANGETGIVVHRLIDPKHPVVYALHQDTTAPYETPRKRMTASHRDFEIVEDVEPGSVRARIDPEALWPPSATDDVPAAPA